MGCNEASHLLARSLSATISGTLSQHTGLQALRALVGAQAGTWHSSGGHGAAVPGDASSCAVGVAAAAVAAATGVAAADSQQEGNSAAQTSWFSRLAGSNKQQAATEQQQADPSPASGTAAWQQQQQQQQWIGTSDEPLSGAIPLLTEEGLTNHPLDYNPITNEHTAAMTMAKQAGVEAYQAGRYGEAERRFLEALAEARLGFPPGDPHIPSCLHYLAELYRNTGQYDKAQQLYQQAIDHLADNLGEKHWMYAAALCSLAALHEQKGDYDQARALLESALDLRRAIFSAGSYMYADTASHLAAVLIKQYSAAHPGGSSGNSNSSSSSSSGGWFGRGKSSTAAGPPDVLRAIALYQAAITIVEDAGHIEGTPITAWLVDMAAGQQLAGQNAAAVASLQKALQYMAIPPSDTGSSSSSSNSSGQVGEGAATDSSSGSSSSDNAPDAAAASAAAAAAAAGRKVMVQASEVAERLVDAQLAAGDMSGARATLREAVEARTALYGRHLVVAKSMTRLANLLMAAPPDPAAAQLAPHFAASAVAIAETSLQGAQRSSLWRGMLRNVLQPKAHLEAERSGERLMAALQLGNACLALAAAEKMNGRQEEAEQALRKAVGQLRWVLGVGAQDLARLRSTAGKAAAGEGSLLARVAGLLVDLKLLQLDCLEALAAAVQEKTAAVGSSAVGDGDEVRALLGEAEQLAAELYKD